MVNMKLNVPDVVLTKMTRNWYEFLVESLLLPTVVGRSKLIHNTWNYVHLSWALSKRRESLHLLQPRMGSLSAAALRKIRLDLEGSLGSSVNKVSPSSPALPSDKLKVYQSTAARLNYLALDRPDIGFGVKELMRRMARPTEQDLQVLKRVVRSSY